MNIFKFALFVFLLGHTNYSFSQEKDQAGTDTKKPKNETKYSEVVNTDSVRASELLKRAVNWVKLENVKYDKTNGVTTADKAECFAKFTIKPKELNPECDYAGTVTLKVVVECKDNKYRYTINQIKHVSKSGKTTGGSIDNIVPECGSIVMSDLIWKKVRGECIRCATAITSDLKEAMTLDSKQPADEW